MQMTFLNHFIRPQDSFNSHQPCDIGGSNIVFSFIERKTEIPRKNFTCLRLSKKWCMGLKYTIPDHLTWLLRNLCASQEATVRTGHGTADWFQIGKGVHQGCILSPCLFDLYEEYIMRNAGLDEAQAGIKIARRNTKAQDMQMIPPSWQKAKWN